MRRSPACSASWDVHGAAACKTEHHSSLERAVDDSRLSTPREFHQTRPSALDSARHARSSDTKVSKWPKFVLCHEPRDWTLLWASGILEGTSVQVRQRESTPSADVVRAGTSRAPLSPEQLMLPISLKHTTALQPAETLWHQPFSLILSDQDQNNTAFTSHSHAIEFWARSMEPPQLSTPAAALGTPGRRRNGRLQACEPCRKRKVSCDHAFPACRRCRVRNNPGGCVYLGVEEASRKTAQARPRGSVRAAR